MALKSKWSLSITLECFILVHLYTHSDSTYRSLDRRTERPKSFANSSAVNEPLSDTCGVERWRHPVMGKGIKNPSPYFSVDRCFMYMCPRGHAVWLVKPSVSDRIMFAMVKLTLFSAEAIISSSLWDCSWTTITPLSNTRSLQEGRGRKECVYIWERSG